MGLADDMIPAILQRYHGEKVQRVVDAWERVRVGKSFTEDRGSQGYQEAASYIEGLDAEAWHDAHRYPWIAALESKASAIADELRSVQTNVHQGHMWEPAARENAHIYGDGWERIVLQDTTWNDTSCSMFPETTALLQASGEPSVEAYFARQRPSSGVSAHTASTNFFITANIGLEIPRGDCWIQVGNEKRRWSEGKGLVFDSSFLHSTRNDADSDRTVLVVKFWHPQLEQVERDALGFIFQALSEPSVLRQPYTPPSDLAPTSMSSSQGETRSQSTGSDTEKLDVFLDSLKEDGLLPEVSSPDEFLARGPGNRSARRKAAKRSRQGRPGEGSS